MIYLDMIYRDFYAEIISIFTLILKTKRWDKVYETKS